MSKYVCKTAVCEDAGDYFESRRWIFCADTVREYFHLPEEVKSIQLFGYKKPGKNRFHVCIGEDELIEIDGRIEFFLVIITDLIIAKLKKHGDLYVECVYEDHS